MTDSLYSETSETSEDKHIARHLNLYYNKSNKNENNYENENNVNENTLSCTICNNKSNKGSFIILSCNHIFHVQCLAEAHFKDNVIYNYSVIDNAYFSTRKCQCCGQELQSEELIFMHSKFLSITKDRLESHQTTVASLEDNINKMKEELKICYDYKQKLECDREKSKQIVKTLLNTLP